MRGSSRTQSGSSSAARKAMSKAAEEVKKLIDAIGEVTLKSEKKIQNARKAYDALKETRR